MSFTLPFPTVPTNGQTGDATPILSNETALAQAIANFDGSQVQSKTIVESGLADAINPRLRDSEQFFGYVDSGCVWSLVSGFSGTMTGGTIYVNGYRVVVSGVGANTFAASSDTYVYIDYLGNVTYSAVANSAASPSATANAILVAIVVTSGATITFVNQGQTDTTLSGFAPTVSSNKLTVSDSLGNLIYPTDPNMKVLGYRESTSTQAFAAGPTDITGLSVSVIVPAGRKIRITAYSYNLSTGSGANASNVNILEGSTQLGSGRTNVANGSSNGPIFVPVFTYPTTGLHTYKITGTNDVNTNVTFGATTTARAFILVELE